MRWRFGVKWQFLAVYAAMLAALLAGIIMGAASFSRVGVGGSLYQGLKAKKEILLYLAESRATISTIPAQLPAWKSSRATGASSSLENRVAAVDATLTRLAGLTARTEGAAACRSCHTGADLESVAIALNRALDQWRQSKELTAKIAAGSGSEPAAAALREEHASLLAQVSADLEAVSEELKDGAPRQEAAIVSDAVRIKTGFIGGGLAMTLFLLIASALIGRHTARRVGQQNLELLAVATDLNTIAQDHSTKIEDVAHAVAEMSSTIEAVASNTAEAFQAAEEASEIAVYGKETSGYTSAAIKKGAAVVRETSVLVQSLGDRSTEIGKILSVIDSIALQTNILALNAAVEAARAGEHGRGFDVVANEVRKLAQRTSKATEEIAAVVAAVRDETGQAVGKIAQSKDEVERSVKLIEAVSQSFDSIVTSSAEACQMVQQIAEQARSQADTVRKVSADVAKIASTYKDTSETALRLQRVSGQLE